MAQPVTTTHSAEKTAARIGTQDVGGFLTG